MKLIELHILQSFPVTCLNRDDLGSPKSAFFGGANRARISSQCLKRAIRLHAKTTQPDLLGGIRTRYVPHLLSEELGKFGIGEVLVSLVSDAVAEALKNKVDASKDARRFTTLVFLSPTERSLLAGKLLGMIEGLSADERTAIESAASEPQPAEQGGKKPKKAKDSPRLNGRSLKRSSKRRLRRFPVNLRTQVASIP
ncbi:MAG: type I-E CRISPR-associated protein Cas7/Cse4/CasC [Verrucomicrobia bacterium]|nr:type I-E CRISPR-associated protein Cas7/Cse4/CasC [Verrucomicrobiota bacterium]